MSANTVVNYSDVGKIPPIGHESANFYILQRLSYKTRPGIPRPGVALYGRG
jgi:hypothetical protein